MWKPFRSRPTRYLLPFGAILAALLVQAAVSPLVPKGVDFPYPFFYLIAVLAAAWFGGYAPGAIACLLTMVGIPYLAIRGFRLTSVDPSRVTLLLAVSLLISRVSYWQQGVRDTLSSANDELDKRVRDRTQDLARAVETLESEIERRKHTEQKLQTQLGRLSLLDQTTRAIGERQDLRSIFQVVIRSLEDSLPIDFGCICLYDHATRTLTVTCVGVHSESLAMQLAMTEHANIAIDQNGLSHCVQGQLVYEPDVRDVEFPFPQRLSSAGLCSAVVAPLLFESQVFGVLVAARRQPNSFSSTDCEFLRQLSVHVALAARQAEIHSALQQAYEDLRETQQSVMQEDRLRSLGQMASGIAHDINNAVSPMAVYTESLLENEPDLSPRIREYLEIAQRTLGDVAETVSRMQEFYREREPQLVLKAVKLNPLVQQVLELTRARWSDMPQQRGIFIDVRTDLAHDLPEISGVESEIREALVNLILNAVDAMPDGGKLTLRTEASGRESSSELLRHVHIEVNDTGVGMNEETRRHCLEPFFTTKGERGTGLGLAMVFGVVRRHNAEIEIESTPGKGTAVRLILPERLVAAEPGLPAGDQPMPRHLRILLADDDPLILKVLRETLEGDGHVVINANGGQECIEAFRSTQGGKRFDVVITDLGMPRVDGRRVALEVKAARPSTPVILLTGWGERLIAEGDVSPHVNCVLNKPPKLRELRKALAELTASSSQAASGLNK